MISFPHCKINLGLDVLRKRPDGYHDIETVMFPVRDLCDSLEIIVPEEEKEATELTESGLRTGCPPQENIVMKAWRLMHETYGIGNVRMHLHKAVPSGAGLGGGSADGAAALRMLDTLFSVGAGIRRLEALALKLGSDVPFFLHDAPQLCSGRGEVMRPAEINLKGYWMVLVKPAICIPTAEAYAGITPRIPEEPLAKRLSRPIATWRDNLLKHPSSANTPNCPQSNGRSTMQEPSTPPCRGRVPRYSVCSTPGPNTRRAPEYGTCNSDADGPEGK